MKTQIVALMLNPGEPAREVARVPHNPREYPTDHFALEQLQGWVDGLIDVVRVQDTAPGLQELVINDEGAVLGLPFNRAASALAGVPLCGPVVAFYLEEQGGGGPV